MKIIQIISGGQTGTDRAALDAAIDCGVPHGGWCPKGRRAEDGVIPEMYHLKETDSPNYEVRTFANVADSDLTLIFSHGLPVGGSLLTLKLAEEISKPCIHIDLNKPLQGLGDVFSNIGNAVVNIAGPRASEDPHIYDAVFDLICDLLTHFSG